MVLAGIVFVLTNNYVFLIIAAIMGVISPSGNEIGSLLREGLKLFMTLRCTRALKLKNHRKKRERIRHFLISTG
jgi:hypothetical protein